MNVVVGDQPRDLLLIYWESSPEFRQRRSKRKIKYPVLFRYYVDIYLVNFRGQRSDHLGTTERQQELKDKQLLTSFAE